MSEDLAKLQELVNTFAEAEFDLKTKVRQDLLDRGVSARMADMIIVNGSIRNLSWVLDVVVGQIVGDLGPSEKTSKRGEEIFKKLSLSIRDIIAEHSGKQVAFFSGKISEEDPDGHE